MTSIRSSSRRASPTGLRFWSSPLTFACSEEMGIWLLIPPRPGGLTGSSLVNSSGLEVDHRVNPLQRLDFLIGPRPLRTGSFPNGLPALCRREWEQVRIGSRLVHFIFEILLELAVIGGCGFIEHPQWPLWATHHDPSSIWATTMARCLKSLACCSVVSFDQCIVGSPAKKPTTLLLLRLDSLRHKLLQTGHAGRCPHHAAACERLQGRNEQGDFRTAVGKVYPEDLNRAIGQAVCRYAETTLLCELLHNQLPEPFHCFRQQIFEDAEVVQPDFHRPS